MDDRTFVVLMEELQSVYETADTPKAVREWFVGFRVQLQGSRWSAPADAGPVQSAEAAALMEATRVIERAGFWDLDSLRMMRRAVVQLHHDGPEAAARDFNMGRIA